MTFVHPLLLTGLLLAGIPILLHLIMRQKPKRLQFPAFRFLLQKQRTNQRSLRLRHLLLLALRVFLIVAMCLALAHPRLFQGVLPGEQPVAAVLLFDTSFSMEYTVAGKTRLDEAKDRALELFKELPPESRVAILDSAEVGGEWSHSLAQARQRVDELKLRHANNSVNRQIDQAYRLFNDLDQDVEHTAEPLPRFLYVFSDRTTACWDTGASANQRPPDGVGTAFVDVGVKGPEDMAILKVEAEPPVVAAGNSVYIKVTVRAHGKAQKNTVVCTFDNEATGKDEEVDLQPGATQEIAFERKTTDDREAAGTSGELKPGLHQVTLRLRAGDALPFNNVGYATFTVREGRRVLVVADDSRDSSEWSKALRVNPAFLVDELPTAKAEQLDLKGYAAVCLVDVAKPTKLWSKLDAFVRAGGSLAIVPGGEERMPDLAAYNDDKTAQGLMPGQIADKLIVVDTADKGDSYWSELLPTSTAQNRFLEPFRRWRQRADIDFLQPDSAPWANRFFRVTKNAGSEVLAHYAKGDFPALLERSVGKGRVLLFTTAFDERLRDGKYRWNNYNEGSFYFVLVNHAVSYLVGDTESARLNYVCGQTITVNLPAGTPPKLFTLQGPGLSAAESNLPYSGDQNKIVVASAKTGTPGNFTIIDPDHVRVAAFSLNGRPEESLLDVVPAEQIEKVLGPGSVVTVGYGESLRTALKDRWNQPLDLLPWLLIAVLLVLAVENLLANKFYRRQPEQTAA